MNRKKIVRKKTAILVVSYGCNHERMRAKTIGRIEADIQKAYPEYLISHAWTSQIIRRKCFEQERIRIPGVKEAMEELFRRGIQQVVVQQTHLLNGLENRRMIEDVETFAEDFSQLIIGAPLLASYEDKRKVIHIIEEEIRLKNGEALALVGHGLKGGEEETLGELGAMFRELGYEDIFLGSMEGQPDFQSVLERIRRRNAKHILLTPFMIAAGKHAERDLCGEKDTSWKSRFEEAGFSTTCILKGLGEYEGIRQIFAEHVEDSLRILNKQSFGAYL